MEKWGQHCPWRQSCGTWGIQHCPGSACNANVTSAPLKSTYVTKSMKSSSIKPFQEKQAKGITFRVAQILVEESCATLLNRTSNPMATNIFKVLHLFCSNIQSDDAASDCSNSQSSFTKHFRQVAFEGNLIRMAIKSLCCLKINKIILKPCCVWAHMASSLSFIGA